MFAPGMMHHVTLRFSGKSLTGPRRFCFFVFFFVFPVRVCVRACPFKWWPIRRRVFVSCNLAAARIVPVHGCEMHRVCVCVVM